MKIVDRAEAYVKQLINAQISSALCFHNLEHTQSVVKAVKIITSYEPVAHEELEILLLAAWFHDAGFVKRYQGHEQVSCEIAIDQLTRWGYDPHKIERIADCIKATKIPQQPKNELQKILCDADLFHLADEDYWKKNNRLQKELYINKHKNTAAAQWYLQNLEFLISHQYHTNYGRDVLEARKKKNVLKNLEYIRGLIYK